MRAWLVRGLIALVASVAAAAVITDPVAALESGAAPKGLIYDATVDVAQGAIVDSPGFVAPAEQLGNGGVEPAGISAHVYDPARSRVAPRALPTGSLPSPTEAADLIRSATPTGRGLADGVIHRSAPWAVDDVASNGSVFRIVGGDGVERTLV